MYKWFRAINKQKRDVSDVSVLVKRHRKRTRFLRNKKKKRVLTDQWSVNERQYGREATKKNGRKKRCSIDFLWAIV